MKPVDPKRAELGLTHVGALVAPLAALAYPISKEAAIERVGAVVLTAGETPVTLAEIMRGVAQDIFTDAHQASRAVGGRWRRIARNLAAVEAAERAAIEARRRR